MATKPKLKPKLRKNRYSVRCHSYQNGYLMFEGELDAYRCRAGL